MQTGQPAKMRQLKLALRAAFPRTVPVMVGYLFLGAAFGILLESKGYGFGWAALMSIFIYAGSMQFVAVDLLATGAGFLQVILMTLMVNIRHVFYGISMLGKFRNLGAKKPYMIFSLTDETFLFYRFVQSVILDCGFCGRRLARFFFFVQHAGN